jgi:hypothetical protein
MLGLPFCARRQDGHGYGEGNGTRVPIELSAGSCDAACQSVAAAARGTSKGHMVGQDIIP